jgi:hypothetical protein
MLQNRCALCISTENPQALRQGQNTGGQPSAGSSVALGESLFSVSCTASGGFALPPGDLLMARRSWQNPLLPPQSLPEEEK